MWFLRIAEELSEGLNILVEESQFVLSPTFQTVILLSEGLFLRVRAVFLRPELSRGTTIAAEIVQAVVDLKLKVK